jgi:predicted RNA-binding Zn-ribbon protein involved in translation (DUF1610 family)
VTPPESRYCGLLLTPPISNIGRPTGLLGMIRIANFTCPQTGGKASAVVPAAGKVSATYEEVLCPACGWYHVVNIEMGELPPNQSLDLEDK